MRRLLAVRGTSSEVRAGRGPAPSHTGTSSPQAITPGSRSHTGGPPGQNLDALCTKQGVLLAPKGGYRNLDYK